MTFESYMYVATRAAAVAFLRECAAKAASEPQQAGERVSLNLDHDEARALHRIVRAMHDGECPKCHGIAPSFAMRQQYINHHHTHQGWRCSCGFEISGAEAGDILKEFAPFMERNLAVFEKWRASRAAPPPSHAPAAPQAEGGVYGTCDWGDCHKPANKLRMGLAICDDCDAKGNAAPQAEQTT